MIQTQVKCEYRVQTIWTNERPWMREQSDIKFICVTITFLSRSSKTCSFFLLFLVPWPLKAAQTLFRSNLIYEKWEERKKERKIFFLYFGPFRYKVKWKKSCWMQTMAVRVEMCNWPVCKHQCHSIKCILILKNYQEWF